MEKVAKEAELKLRAKEHEERVEQQQIATQLQQHQQQQLQNMNFNATATAANPGAYCQLQNVLQLFISFPVFSPRGTGKITSFKLLIFWDEPCARTCRGQNSV